ncbi:hypothetical protein KC19_VG158500 [Ceratodon purpureus]|uniref:Uncharacterized protein n=1 Tax=Ceratodon purpureus TaxID=3225 RepID=A0A8T0HQJ9_CERPU|nr:hypothetical protein KC19_VG158500 [Ceratodon purpureus]
MKVRFKISVLSSSSELPLTKRVNLLDQRRLEEITRIVGTGVCSVQEESPRSHLQRNSQPMRLDPHVLPLTLANDTDKHEVSSDVTFEGPTAEQGTDQNCGTLVGNEQEISSLRGSEAEATYSFVGEDLDDEHTLAVVFPSPKPAEQEDDEDIYSEDAVEGRFTSEAGQVDFTGVQASNTAVDTVVVVFSNDEGEDDDMF